MLAPPYGRVGKIFAHPNNVRGLVVYIRGFYPE